ncbi:helix-turn-helix domain-containing protein [Mariniflexile soesokkakense]|uniref:Helix-turn-helix domain-containing protein n=1 Tax=Mariniflexile soesokkakense TaxID=1343160 RepID=A0ABV0AE37_9FLAO
MKLVIEIEMMNIKEIRSLFSSMVKERLYKFRKIYFKKNRKNLNSDLYLSRNAAAEFLKISKTTLWRLDKNQNLPAQRLNGRVYYFMSDLSVFQTKKMKVSTKLFRDT